MKSQVSDSLSLNVRAYFLLFAVFSDFLECLIDNYMQKIWWKIIEISD